MSDEGMPERVYLHPTSTEYHPNRWPLEPSEYTKYVRHDLAGGAVPELDSADDYDLLVQAVQVARQVQEFIWAGAYPTLRPYDAEGWRRLFQKRVDCIAMVDLTRHGGLAALRKRLLQQAALSVKALALVNRWVQQNPVVFPTGLDGADLVLDTDTSTPHVRTERHRYIPTQLCDNAPCAWADHPDAIGDARYYCGEPPSHPFHVDDDQACATPAPASEAGPLEETIATATCPKCGWYLSVAQADAVSVECERCGYARDLVRAPSDAAVAAAREIAELLIFNTGERMEEWTSKFTALITKHLPTTPAAPSAEPRAAMIVRDDAEHFIRRWLHSAQWEGEQLMVTFEQETLIAALIGDVDDAVPSAGAGELDDGWVTFGRVKVDIENETETFERIDPPVSSGGPEEQG